MDNRESGTTAQPEADETFSGRSVKNCSPSLDFDCVDGTAKTSVQQMAQGISKLESESQSEDFFDSGSEYSPGNNESSSDSLEKSSPALSPLTSLVQKRKKCTKKKNPGRKRIDVMSEWGRVKAKVALNTGQEHLTRGGRLKAAKAMGPGCSSTCRLKCSEKITKEQRETIFKRFWLLGDKTRQWNFIVENLRTVDKKVAKVGSMKRTCSRNFFLKICGTNDNNISRSTIEEIRVCKKMFIDTLSISRQVIDTAYTKLTSGSGVLSPDKRGLHVRPVNEVKEKNKILIRAHISEFPAVESHYARKDTAKKYLSSDLNISKMFSPFKEKSPEVLVSERQYRDIFNTEFNLSFHVSKKDQCDECTSYKNDPDKHDETKSIKYAEHIYNKDLARLQKENDKKRTMESDGKVLIVCYDFQK